MGLPALEGPTRHASRQTAHTELGCTQLTFLLITEVPETQGKNSIGAEVPGHDLPCSAQGYSHRMAASGAWAEGWEQSFWGCSTCRVSGQEAVPETASCP